MFYFVEPTEENFSQYEKWVSSARQSEVFFGDMVKNCYKCSVKPGQTMFIPTGTNLYYIKQVEEGAVNSCLVHSPMD